MRYIERNMKKMGDEVNARRTAFYITCNIIAILVVYYAIIGAMITLYKCDDFYTFNLVHGPPILVIALVMIARIILT